MPAFRTRYDHDRHSFTPYPYPDRRERSASDRPQYPVRSPPPARLHGESRRHRRETDTYIPSYATESSQRSYANHDDGSGQNFTHANSAHTAERYGGYHGHSGYYQGSRYRDSDLRYQQAQPRGSSSIANPQSNRASYGLHDAQGSTPFTDWQLQRLQRFHRGTGWGTFVPQSDSTTNTQSQAFIGTTLQNPATTASGFYPAGNYAQYAYTFAPRTATQQNWAQPSTNPIVNPLTLPVADLPARPNLGGNTSTSAARFVQDRISSQMPNLDNRYSNSRGDNYSQGKSDIRAPQRSLNPTAAPFAAPQGGAFQRYRADLALTSSEATRRSARLAAQQSSFSTYRPPKAPSPKPKSPEARPPYKKNPTKKNSTKKNPTNKPIKPPTPSAEYMQQSSAPPQRLASPKHLLVVLDLNGTLIHRAQKGGSAFNYRPRVKEFLHYLFNHHAVMVWSSARGTNVNAIVDRLFEPHQKEEVVAVWAREELRLTPLQYNSKVQVYKHLSWIWSDKDIQGPDSSVQEWSQANTVLIDDSIEKARSEPFNLIQIEEFENRADQHDTDVLGQVVHYLEVLRKHVDVSAYIKSTGGFKYDENAVSFDWTDIELEMAFDKQVRLAEEAEGTAT